MHSSISTTDTARHAMTHPEFVIVDAEIGAFDVMTKEELIDYLCTGYGYECALARHVTTELLAGRMQHFPAHDAAPVKIRLRTDELPKVLGHSFGIHPRIVW